MLEAVLVIVGLALFFRGFGAYLIPIGIAQGESSFPLETRDAY